MRRQAALSVSKRYGPKAIFFLLDQLSTVENKKYRSAALASLMGRELEALDLIAISNILTIDTPLHRKTLSSIVLQILAGKKASTNTLLLEFAAKQANQHAWQSEVVLSAILAKQKQAQLRLTRKPTRYNILFASSSSTLYEVAVAINGLLWWEGRSDVQEFIPKRVDKTVANLITRGKKIYNICKTCHQVDGLGLPPTYPPLVDSPFVLDGKGKLIKIMLHGLSGPINVAGKHYDESMPPAPIRNDYDIAAVMTYIRQAWGNDGDAITQSEVASMRERYKDRTSMWTAEELEN